MYPHCPFKMLTIKILKSNDNQEFLIRKFHASIRKIMGWQLDALDVIFLLDKIRFL